MENRNVLLIFAKEILIRYIMETYSVSIEVRTDDGKLLRNENGFNYSELLLDINIKDGNEEKFLIGLSNTLKVWLPNNQINIGLSVLNNISGTYMLMFSYYVNEKRFVKY